ncbi:hypothetical protein SAMN05428995_105424 [Loktanella sp. DSM 29012]|nr:hypothetical protein SAMN05428995_105424 [Loktanella sp. DSM 29012]
MNRRGVQAPVCAFLLFFLTVGSQKIGCVLAVALGLDHIADRFFLTGRYFCNISAFL